MQKFNQNCELLNAILLSCNMHLPPSPSEILTESFFCFNIVSKKIKTIRLKDLRTLSLYALKPKELSKSSNETVLKNKVSLR